MPNSSQINEGSRIAFDSSKDVFFAMKKLVYNLLNIATLLLCAILKVVAHIHIATRAIFKRLLTKALFLGFLANYNVLFY